MRRTYAFLLLLVLIFTSGAVLSQSVPVAPEATPEATPEIAFQIEAEIGRALPKSLTTRSANGWPSTPTTGCCW